MRRQAARSPDPAEGASTAAATSSSPLNGGVSTADAGSQPSGSSKDCCAQCCAFIPRPLRILNVVANEAFERFAFYGVRALLIVYLTTALHYSNSTAVAVYSVFNAVCYLTPLLGSYLADACVGKFVTILTFNAIYLVGLLGLAGFAFDNNVPGVIVGLFLLAVGTGGIKPNISPLGAEQIEHEDLAAERAGGKDKGSARGCRSRGSPRAAANGSGSPSSATAVAVVPAPSPAAPLTAAEYEERRRSFFAFFYWAVNIGSAISFIVTPLIRVHAGYGWAFLTCFAALLLSVVILLLPVCCWQGYYDAPPSKNSAWARLADVCCKCCKQRCRMAQAGDGRAAGKGKGGGASPASITWVVATDPLRPPATGSLAAAATTGRVAGAEDEPADAEDEDAAADAGADADASADAGRGRTRSASGSSTDFDGDADADADGSAAGSSAAQPLLGPSSTSSSSSAAASASLRHRTRRRGGGSGHGHGLRAASAPEALPAPAAPGRGFRVPLLARDDDLGDACACVNAAVLHDLQEIVEEEAEAEAGAEAEGEAGAEVEAQAGGAAAAAGSSSAAAAAATAEAAAMGAVAGAVSDSSSSAAASTASAAEPDPSPHDHDDDDADAGAAEAGLLRRRRRRNPAGPSSPTQIVLLEADAAWPKEDPVPAPGSAEDDARCPCCPSVSCYACCCCLRRNCGRKTRQNGCRFACGTRCCTTSCRCCRCSPVPHSSKAAGNSEGSAAAANAGSSAAEGDDSDAPPPPHAALLPFDLYSRAHAGGLRRLRTTQGFVRDVRAVLRLLPLFAVMPVFWLCFDAQGSLWTLQRLSMSECLGALCPSPEMLGVLNPILVVIMIPLFDRGVFPLLEKLGTGSDGRRNILYPTPLRRMGAGMQMAALAFVCAGALQAAVDAAPPKSISQFAQLPQFLLISVAEILVSITGLEFAFAQAPKDMRSTLLAIYYLSISAGGLLTAVLYAGLKRIMPEVAVIYVFAGGMCLAGIAFVILAVWYRPSKAAGGAAAGDGAASTAPPVGDGSGGGSGGSGSAASAPIAPSSSVVTTITVIPALAAAADGAAGPGLERGPGDRDAPPQ